MVSIHQLANFFIHYCGVCGTQINHTKLQMLLYHVQCWHTGNFNGHPLFEDVAEAWVRGPIYTRIHEVYKNIQGENLGFDYNTIEAQHQAMENLLKELSVTKKQEKFLADFLIHHAFENWELLLLSVYGREKNRNPWSKAREDSEMLKYSREVISHQSMFEHYYPLAKKQNYEEGN